MSGWSGNGDFTFTYNWVNDAANGVPITASRMDTQFNDAISGFENCITRDNQGKPSATILPDTTSAYDLGSPSYTWRAGYFSGAVSTSSASGYTNAALGETIILNVAGLTSTAAITCIADTGGVILNTGATSWAAVSDETAKLFFDPIPVQGALARVASWRAGTYRYKWDTEETPRRVGLIAQDVARDRPEAVSMDKDGLLNLRLAETIPDLVAALAEALQRIQALEAI